MESFDADVCIVGGGVAGLYAAEILGQAGATVILLEARDRLGGRIVTEFAPDGSGVPIELGAEFIHGQPPTLLSMIRRRGLRTSPMRGRMYRVSGNHVKPADDDSRLDEVLQSLSESKLDEPFESFIRRANVDSAAAEWATSYVEGFNAADAKLIGTRALAYQQEAEEQIGGGESRRLDGGYTELVEALAERRKPGAQIALNTVVSRVSWKRGHARVEANRRGENPVAVKAKAVIITVPISILQRGQSTAAAIEFEPMPPVFADLDGVVMGNAVRLNLLFRTPVWENAAPDLGFLLSKEPCFPTWWTRVSGSNYLMTAWCAGPKAKWTEGKSKDELTRTAIGTLATLLRTEDATLESALLSSHHHDWRADPFSCGAYSYVKAAGFDAAQRLARPVEDTLWFAGESMAVDGHWGTVHGAMDSGRRAAEDAVRNLKA